MAATDSAFDTHPISMEEKSARLTNRSPRLEKNRSTAGRSFLEARAKNTPRSRRARTIPAGPSSVRIPDHSVLSRSHTTAFRGGSRTAGSHTKPNIRATSNVA